VFESDRSGTQQLYVMPRAAASPRASPLARGATARPSGARAAT
jgi:hypothetical protein